MDQKVVRKLEKELKRKEKALAEAAGRPQLGVTGGVLYASPNRAFVPPDDTWRWSWDIGVQVSMQVFDGGRPSAAAARARAQVEALRQRLDDLDRRIRLDVTRAFLEVQGEFGTFDEYIWRFTGGRTIRNAWADMSELPAETDESRAMSRDLKKRGFKFVGPTICYAYMQAAGLVNDHVVSCFRYAEVGRARLP